MSDKRFAAARVGRTDAPHWTAQPSDRRSARWYVWDMANGNPAKPEPVFVGSMEECISVAGALNEVCNDD